MPAAGSGGWGREAWLACWLVWLVWLVWPANRMAHRAGERVSELKAEITVLAAIVRANCR